MFRAVVILIATLSLSGCLWHEVNNPGLHSLQTTKHDPLWTTASDPYGCRAYPKSC